MGFKIKMVKYSSLAAGIALCGLAFATAAPESLNQLEANFANGSTPAPEVHAAIGHVVTPPFLIGTITNQNQEFPYMTINLLQPGNMLNAGQWSVSSNGVNLAYGQTAQMYYAYPNSALLTQSVAQVVISFENADHQTVETCMMGYVNSGSPFPYHNGEPIAWIPSKTLAGYCNGVDPMYATFENETKDINVYDGKLGGPN